MQPIWEALTEHKWSDAQLTELDQKLAELDFLKDHEFITRGERASALELIDYICRTRNFDMLKNGFRSFPDLPEPKMEVLKYQAKLVVLELAPASISYQNKLNYARIFQQSFLPIVNMEQRTVSPDMAAKFNEAVGKLDEHWSPNSRLAYYLLHTLGISYKKFAYAQSSVDMARIACALERYHLAHNEYHETLDTLAPQFIEKLPHDIIGGQPLHYRRVGDGKFLLYSVGWNGTDDGGVVVLNEHFTSVDDKKSDWVWQYPQK
jgi:hypothetical protein